MKSWKKAVPPAIVIILAAVWLLLAQTVCFVTDEGAMQALPTWSKIRIFCSSLLDGKLPSLVVLKDDALTDVDAFADELSELDGKEIVILGIVPTKLARHFGTDMATVLPSATTYGTAASAEGLLGFDHVLTPSYNSDGSTVVWYYAKASLDDTAYIEPDYLSSIGTDDYLSPLLGKTVCR